MQAGSAFAHRAHGRAQAGFLSVQTGPVPVHAWNVRGHEWDVSAQSGPDLWIRFRSQLVGPGVVRPPLACLCPHVASSSADVYRLGAHVDCDSEETYGFCTCASPQLPPVTGFCTRGAGTRPLRAPPRAGEVPRCAAAHGCGAELRRPRAPITCSSASRALFGPPRACHSRQSAMLF